MQIEEWLYKQFSDSPIGGMDTYWLRAPSGAATPYVTWQLVDDSSEKVFLSVYGGQARVQFEVWSDNKFDVVDKRSDIKDRVRGLQGSWPDIEIMAARVSQELTRELPEDEVYSGLVDVIFDWQEA